MNTYFSVLSGAILFAFQSIQSIVIEDIHKIHQATVKEYHQPTTVSEIQNIVAHARDAGLHISIAGKRHTQGGQTLCDDIVIDMTKFNKILHIDVLEKTITVQPGVIWADIQKVVEPLGLAITTMQYFNNFTVGGSLSVNCNGHDITSSMLIDSIQSIKIITADGQILTADRNENSELFRLAIGGYGLFGIIIEATLKLTSDCLFKRKTRVIPADQYYSYFMRHIKHNKKVAFHYVRLSCSKHTLFQDALVTTCYQTQDDKKSVKFPPFWHKLLYNPFHLNLVRNYDFFKKTNFFIESSVLPKLQYISRNNSMKFTTDGLPFDCPEYVNELQEYFIPSEKLSEFLASLKLIIEKQNVNLLYFIMRYVPKNIESFLSYAQKDCMGTVLFMPHERTNSAYEQQAKVTRLIIDQVSELGGTFYLVSQRYATHDQLRRAYPMIGEFFAKKLAYDPHEIFSNMWYKASRGTAR